VAEVVRQKDSLGLSDGFAPEVLLLDLIDPLQYVGADGLKKRAKEWLSSFQGPVDFDVRDLRITAGNEVAFCHSLNHSAE
jgi:ketosteroid isomerase-like protein